MDALAGARENVQGKVEHLQEELAHLPLLANQVGAWGCCLLVCSSKVWRSGSKELADTGKKVQGKVERVEVSLVHPLAPARSADEVCALRLTVYGFVV